MLNLPYCINHIDVTNYEAFTASFSNSESIIDAISLSSNSKLDGFDPAMIRPLEFSNSCEKLQQKHDLSNYCKLCSFSDSNIISRLDEEVEKLSQIFLSNDATKYSLEEFQYLIHLDNDIFISPTRDIYEILKTNTDVAQSIRALNEYHPDVEIVSIIVNKLKEYRTIHNDELKEKHDEMHSDYYSSQDIVLILNAKQMNDDAKQSKLRSKKSKLPKQDLNTETANDENTKGQIEIADRVHKEIGETHTETETIISGPSSTSIDFFEFNLMAIAAKCIYIEIVQDELILCFPGHLNATYSLNSAQTPVKEFMNTIFNNKNIIKVVDDLKSFSELIRVFPAFSVYDFSESPFDGNSLNTKYVNYTQSNDVSKITKFKNICTLSIVKNLYKSEKYNLKIKLLSPSHIFDLLILEMQNHNLFTKYMVHFHHADENEISFDIDPMFYNLAVDHIMIITRKLLKTNNEVPNFEVVVNNVTMWEYQFKFFVK